MDNNYLNIIILSKLANRLRVKLTFPLKSPKSILTKLSEHEGIHSSKYNPVIQSLIINFNSDKIDVEEVLIRLSILYSKENGFRPVKIISSLPKREIPISAYYSLGLIAVSGVCNLFINNKSMQDLLNWVTAGTTLLSIVEHAKGELDTKGSVDPEVVSVMYLINSIRNGKFINASLVTWITNYGRHFFNLNFEEVILKIKKVSAPCSTETFYDVSLANEASSNKNMTIIKALVTKYIDRHTNKGNNLIFSNNSLNLISDRHFSGFKNECEKIIFSNKGCNYLCA